MYKKEALSDLELKQYILDTFNVLDKRPSNFPNQIAF